MAIVSRTTNHRFVGRHATPKHQRHTQRPSAFPSFASHPPASSAPRPIPTADAYPRKQEARAEANPSCKRAPNEADSKKPNNNQEQSMRRVGCSLLDASSRATASPSVLKMRMRPRTTPVHREFASASRLRDSENDPHSSAMKNAGSGHHLYYHSSSSNSGVAVGDEADAGSDRWAPTPEQQQHEREQHEKAEKHSFAREFEKPRMDASFLVNNYTAPALAAAYQDREYTLWLCAELLSEGKLDELETVLKPYHGKLAI
ncbi:hypothetical protein BBJ28_00000907 [Nothophytophthora sp. Chile5]|nr:hypothetical protein BBJ28_00000907 [Nothophytophthora sp. Chile5]